MTAVLRPAGLIALLLATPAAADPGHAARTAAMEDLRRHLSTLTHMASGRAVFDADRATAARTDLAAAAASLPAAYQSAAEDPVFQEKSDRFFAGAEALVTAAEVIDTSTLSGLKAGIAPVVQSCSSCHEVFDITP